MLYNTVSYFHLQLENRQLKLSSLCWIFTLVELCYCVASGHRSDPVVSCRQNESNKLQKVYILCRLSVLTDVNIHMSSLSTALFPGVSSSIRVHEGFRDQHAKTASKILAEVKNLMNSKNTKNVAVVSFPLLKTPQILIKSYPDWPFTWRCIGRTRLFIFDAEPSHCNLHQSSDLRHSSRWGPSVRATH